MYKVNDKCTYCKFFSILLLFISINSINNIFFQIKYYINIISYVFLNFDQ